MKLYYEVTAIDRTPFYEYQGNIWSLSMSLIDMLPKAVSAYSKSIKTWSGNLTSVFVLSFCSCLCWLVHSEDNEFLV